MIFSPTLSMCFGRSGEPSQWEGSFEYPQQMFFLTYIKHVFWVLKGPSHWDSSFEYPQHMFWMRIKWRKWFSNARSYLETWLKL